MPVSLSQRIIQPVAVPAVAGLTRNIIYWDGDFTGWTINNGAVITGGVAIFSGDSVFERVSNFISAPGFPVGKYLITANINSYTSGICTISSSGADATNNRLPQRTGLHRIVATITVTNNIFYFGGNNIGGVPVFQVNYLRIEKI